jgi:hypothetical protein
MPMVKSGVADRRTIQDATSVEESAADRETVPSAAGTGRR